MDFPRRKVTILPTVREVKHVGIYCRVSTAKKDQLHSLAAQISGLTRTVFENEDWRLFDTYIDIQSGADIVSRPGFQRMLADASDGLLDVVIVKSVSRFGRDVLAVESAMQALVTRGVLVIFDQEQFSSDNPATHLYVAAASAASQAENQMRSNSILWGFEQRVKDGTSPLFDRKCYGYENGEDGRLVIVPEEAEVVKKIFGWYLAGYSIVKIVNALEDENVLSPTGKPRWCKRTVECLLANEKYAGRAIVMKNQTGRKNREARPSIPYESPENNPPIISEETFAAVRAEKTRRSNVIRDESGVHRKPTKYSALPVIKAELEKTE